MKEYTTFLSKVVGEFSFHVQTTTVLIVSDFRQSKSPGVKFAMIIHSFQIACAPGLPNSRSAERMGIKPTVKTLIILGRKHASASIERITLCSDPQVGFHSYTWVLNKTHRVVCDQVIYLGLHSRQQDRLIFRLEKRGRHNQSIYPSCGAHNQRVRGPTPDSPRF